MADLSRSSCSAEDPLHACSGLSLFPRTLKSLSISLPRDYQSDNLQQTHTLLESMPFEVQKEHLEQAKAILDDCSEILEEGSGTSVAAEAPKMNPIPNKREKRPGLNRKREPFSFKPTISQPPQNKPTFDPSKYPKPEDYFAAYELYENALKQWEKYTGTSVTDTNQNQPSRRPRRPGLPGSRRKRSSFVLNYTESYLTAINLEASEKENPIPSEQSLERTTAVNVTTADREVDDSTVDTDKNLNNILTEFLGYNTDKLRGDGCVKILEERFGIKPVVDSGKFTTLPEYPDVNKLKLKASVSSPSNRRTALSDIQNQNLLKGINRVVARKNSQSPSSNPSEDQFSFHDSEYVRPEDRQPSEVDPGKDLNTCYRSSVTNDADRVITNASPSNVGTLHVADHLKSSGQTSSCEDTSDTDSGIHRSQSSPDGNADNCVDDSITNKTSATPEVNVDIQTEENEVDVPMSESDANKNAGRSENNDDDDDDINEETDQLDSLEQDAPGEVARKDPFIVEEEDSIPYQPGESSKSPNRAPEQYETMDGSFEHADYVQDQRGEENDDTDTTSGIQVENAQPEVHNSSHEETNKRKTRESRDKNKRGKRSKTRRDESELMQTLPQESGAKKQTKTKTNEREEKKKTKTVTREGKIFASRKSLAGAGTKWETGIRKSTRIKSRPLEYWRGERFLYGRIHESLSTVIGIKRFDSPEKDKGELKVKSFVSDEYKKLLDLAARH